MHDVKNGVQKLLLWQNVALDLYEKKKNLSNSLLIFNIFLTFDWGVWFVCDCRRVSGDIDVVDIKIIYTGNVKHCEKKGLIIKNNNSNN